MQIGFTTLGCPSWDLDTVIRRAREYGFDGVDFRGLLSEIDVTLLPEFTTKLAATMKKFKSAGLVISGISSSVTLFPWEEASTEEKRLAELERSLELASKVDAEMVRIFGGPVRKNMSFEEALAAGRKLLARMAKMARSAGTPLAIETHDHWTESDKLAQLIEDIDPEFLGVLWDIHHPFRMGGEPMEETFERLGERVIDTHVKDSLPGSEKGKFTSTLVGDGDVPLKKALELLDGAGYDGWLVLEHEKRWEKDLAEPEVAFPRYISAMKKWIDEVVG